MSFSFFFAFVVNNAVCHVCCLVEVFPYGCVCKASSPELLPVFYYNYFSRMFFKVDKLVSISFGNFFSAIGINIFIGYFNVPELVNETLV